MTVTNKTNTVEEAGDGVKTAFTFDFPAQAAGDMKVFKVDTTTLVATLQTITTDYTVALNTTTEGGTIIYVTAPTTGENSFIKREMDLDQQTDVPTEGNIPEESLNNAYDKGIMIDIQQQDELDRSLKFAETSSLSGITVPESTSAAARANKLLAYDSAGTNLDLVTASMVLSVDPVAVQGDMVQGSSLGVAEKLVIGSTSGVLQVVAGKAAWVTNPTLLIPTISDLTNMSHDHSNVVNGGTIPVPVNYRSGMNCKWASTTTITVEGGVLDVGGTMPEKTSGTTLNITTDAHWIGGSSLQAVSTGGYIYEDASGNILMHTTAPDESDISGNTSGILRYNDFAGATDYRMIGWFYMNATGSGELSSYEVGNLADGVGNKVVRTDSTQDTVNDTSYGADLTNTEVHFYSSGKGIVMANCHTFCSSTVSANEVVAIIDDGANIVASQSVGSNAVGGVSEVSPSAIHWELYAQGWITFKAQMRVDAGTAVVEEKTMTIWEG